MTVITGETGAGKSILLNALALVLGKRADSKVARDPSVKCIVEAEFSIAPYNMRELFRQNEMDYEDDTIIRREILPNGKSRAFINDSPVTLQQLQLIGVQLIDVHNQNDTSRLVSEDYQFTILDSVGNTIPLVKEYRNIFLAYREQTQALERLKEEKAEAIREQDYLQFIYQELAEANLSNLDQSALEEIYEKLNNVESIQEGLSESNQLLVQEETGGLELLNRVRNIIQKIQSFGSEYQQLWERLNSVVIEVHDISDELERSLETLDADPEVLSETHSKLQTIYRLQQKHAVGSVDELLELESSLEQKLAHFTNVDDAIIELEGELEGLKIQLQEIGENLHQARLQVIASLQKRLERSLNELGLPNAQLAFDLKKTKNFRSLGMDELEVLFSANKGVKMGLLEKVASGGEMSRVMLVVKALLAEHRELPTIIFDEIDTGVSGEIAYKMAEILSGISKKVQVFSITHLPQTAAKGDYHKKVYKEDEQGMTRTLIKDLSQEERIQEIAQMIGGSTVSDSALLHAKQLLN